MALSCPAVRMQPSTPPIAGVSARKGVWTDHIEGRFRKITVHQFALAWWCHSAGHITKRQLRVWFAAHEMAERRRYTDPVNGPERPLYGLDELKALVGGRGSRTADAELSADVKHLGRLGLVGLTDHAITFAVSVDQLAIDDVDGFWTMFRQLPHPRRSVPVPRRILRAMAAGFTRGMTAVVIATLIRSLFWHREQEAYRTDGRTKREWIAEVFGIAPRTVTDARARLIELGWLVPIDTPQYLLNRYGAHDAINTAWSKADSERSDTPKIESSGGGSSASPNAEFSGQLASLDLNSSLSLTGNKNTRKPAPVRAGPSGASLRSALGSRKKKKRRIPGEPNIRDVQQADLDDMGRLLNLYRQAIDLGFAKAGEAGRLDFVAIAERARSRGKRAGALFFWLLRERKTEFITQSDEDEAVYRIKKHLYGDERKREQWGCEPEPTPPPLSEDDKVVVACLRVAQQRRIGDPFRVAQQAKGWTQRQWENAYAAYMEKDLGRGTRYPV